VLCVISADTCELPVPQSESSYIGSADTSELYRCVAGPSEVISAEWSQVAGGEQPFCTLLISDNVVDVSFLNLLPNALDCYSDSLLTDQNAVVAARNVNVVHPESAMYVLQIDDVINGSTNSSRH